MRDVNPNSSSSNNKRPAATLISTSAFNGHGSSTIRNKKLRTSIVQRTHSPKATKAAITSIPSSSPSLVTSDVLLQKVTPTVRGIREIARHFLRSSLNRRNHDNYDGSTSGDASSYSPGEMPSHSLVALPTECTYEVCKMISWNKTESLDESTVAARRRSIQKCKYALIFSLFFLVFVPRRAKIFSSHLGVAAPHLFFFCCLTTIFFLFSKICVVI